MKVTVRDVERASRGINLKRAQSGSEILLALMFNHMGIQPRQGAALLGVNNRYFVHILANGIKGSFVKVVKWELALKENLKLLVEYFLESAEFEALLQLVAPTLYSSEANVVALGVEILCEASDMYHKLEKNDIEEQRDRAAEWFAAGPSVGGVRALLACWNRHPSIRSVIVNLVRSFVISDLVVFLTGMLQNSLSDIEYVTVAHSIFAACCADDELLQAITAQELPVVIVHHLCELSEPAFPAETRLCVLAFITYVWIRFTPRIGADPNAPELIIAALKKAVRDRNVQLQVGAATCLFDLLDQFAAVSDPFAPYVYKMIIFSLIESHGEDALREFISVNLRRTLREMPQAPVGVMVEPLTKQASLNGYDNLDFEFFMVLAEHPRLSVHHGILLMDLAGKVSLNDPVFARLASLPLLMVVSRYASERRILEYVQHFSKLALSTFLHVASSKKRSKGNQTQTGYVRQTLALETLGKLVHLGHQGIIDVIGTMVRTIHGQYPSSHGGEEHPGLSSLLEICLPSLVNVSTESGPEEDRSMGSCASLHSVEPQPPSDDVTTARRRVPGGKKSPRKRNVEKSDLALLHKAFYLLDTERTGLVQKKAFARSLKDDPKICEALESSKRLSVLLRKSVVASLINFRTNNPGRVDFSDFQTFCNKFVQDHNETRKRRTSEQGTRKADIKQLLLPVKNARVQEGIEKARRRHHLQVTRIQEEKERKKLESRERRNRIRGQLYRRIEKRRVKNDDGVGVKYAQRAKRDVSAARARASKIFERFKRRILKPLFDDLCKFRGGNAGAGDKEVYFDDYHRMQSTMNLVEWLHFVRDFKLLSASFSHHQATSVFHQAKLGAPTGRGAQELDFDDFLLCLLDVSSSTKKFGSFATEEERIHALLSHLRDERLKMVENVRVALEKKKSGTSHADILERKEAALYNKVKWNEIDVPSYKVDMPQTLHLGEGMKVALSVIDEVLFRAFKVHTLLSVPKRPRPVWSVPHPSFKLQPSSFTPTEPVETRLYDKAAIEAKKVQKSRVTFGHKVGFGSTYVPAEKDEASHAEIVAVAPRAARLEGTKAAERFREKYVDIKQREEEEFIRHEKKRKRLRKARKQELSKRLEAYYKDKMARHSDEMAAQVEEEVKFNEGERMREEAKRKYFAAQKTRIREYKEKVAAREREEEEKREQERALRRKHNATRVQKRRIEEDRKLLPEELEARKLARETAAALAKKKRDLRIAKLKRETQERAHAVQERIRKRKERLEKYEAEIQQVKEKRKRAVAARKKREFDHREDRRKAIEKEMKEKDEAAKAKILGKKRKDIQKKRAAERRSKKVQEAVASFGEEDFEELDKTAPPESQLKPSSPDQSNDETWDEAGTSQEISGDNDKAGDNEENRSVQNASADTESVHADPKEAFELEDADPGVVSAFSMSGKEMPLPISSDSHIPEFDTPRGDPRGKGIVDDDDGESEKKLSETSAVQESKVTSGDEEEGRGVEADVQDAKILEENSDGLSSNEADEGDRGVGVDVEDEKAFENDSDSSDEEEEGEGGEVGVHKQNASEEESGESSNDEEDEPEEDSAPSEKVPDDLSGGGENEAGGDTEASDEAANAPGEVISESPSNDNEGSDETLGSRHDDAIEKENVSADDAEEKDANDNGEDKGADEPSEKNKSDDGNPEYDEKPDLEDAKTSKEGESAIAPASIDDAASSAIDENASGSSDEDASGSSDEDENATSDEEANESSDESDAGEGKTSEANHDE